MTLSRLTKEGHGKFFHSIPSGSNSVMDATAPSYVATIFGRMTSNSSTNSDNKPMTGQFEYSHDECTSHVTQIVVVRFANNGEVIIPSSEPKKTYGSRTYPVEHE